jgi:microcystin-dependent protein
MANPFVNNATKVNAVIRVRRGPEVDRTETIYESGELIYSTDNKRLFVGDSVDGGATGTNGGTVVGNKNWVTNNFEKLSGILPYDTVYRTDVSKFYLFTGLDYLKPQNYILLNTTSTGGGSYTLPPATTSTLGGVIIKEGLTVSNGYLRVDVDNSTIKIDPVTKKLYSTGGTGGGGTTNIASENVYGIVKVPLDGGVKVSSGNLSVNVDNSTIKLTATPTGSKLYVDGSLVSIPVATNNTLGVVRTGRGLSATATGSLNLNIASDVGLGGIKVGSGLIIDPNDGELSVDGTVYDSIPIGSVHWFAMSAAPTGFLECSGGIVAISDYYDLYEAIGTTYNDGLSTQYYNSSDILTGFKVPDLRGEFIRGWDDGRGVDSNRTFGSNQLDALQNHQHTLSGDTGQVYYTINDYNTNPSDSDSFMNQGPGEANDAQFNPYTGPILGSGTFPATSSVRVESETRPRNVALLPCIKALKTVNNIVVPTGDYIPKPFVANHTDMLVYDDEYGTGGTWVAAPSSTYAGEALLSANGYQKLPSGLIMQWGRANITGSNYEILLPIPFPNQNLNVVATAVHTTSYIDLVEISTWSLSSVTIACHANGANQPTGTINWQAYGY